MKARNTDPATSHEAARRIRNVSQTEAIVLDVLKRPRNSYELVEAYHNLKNAPRVSDARIRTVCSDLTARGLVEIIGREVLPSGNNGQIWVAKNRDRVS